LKTAHDQSNEFVIGLKKDVTKIGLGMEKKFEQYRGKENEG